MHATGHVVVDALSYEKPLLKGSVASFTSGVLEARVQTHDLTDLDLPKLKFPTGKWV